MFFFEVSNRMQLSTVAIKEKCAGYYLVINNVVGIFWGRGSGVFRTDYSFNIKVQEICKWILVL